MGKPRVSLSAIRPLIESGELTHEQAVQRFEIVADTQQAAPQEGPSLGEKAWSAVKDGFANSSIVNVHAGAAKGLGNTVYSLGKLASKIPGVSEVAEAFGADPSYANFEEPTPEVLKPRGAAQHVGYFGEQIAEAALPVGAAGKVATKLGGGLLARTVANAAAAGATELAQTGSLDSGTATAAALGGAAEPVARGIGAVGGMAMDVMRLPLSQKLADRAINQAASLFKVRAGDSSSLAKAREIAPRLVQELRGGTRMKTAEQLAEVVDTRLQHFGSLLEDAYDAIPKGETLSATNLLSQINAAKSKFVAGVDKAGKIVYHSPEAKAAATQLDEFAGGILRLSEKATDGTLRIAHEPIVAAKRLIDKTLSKRGVFDHGALEASRLGAQEEVANLYRRTLAEAYPDVAALNRQVSTWAKASDLVEGLLKRTAGTDTKGNAAALTAGVGAAYYGGGGGLSRLARGLTAAATTKVIRSATSSPQWQLTNASTKLKIADALASGRFAEGLLMPRSITAKGTLYVAPQWERE